MNALRNKVHLLVYPNHIGTNLKDLHGFLKKHLEGVIGGVHILPFYPSNADGGFSPLTHLEVDPEFGTWKDIENISKRFDLCADITLNHISDQSREFQDFIEKGYKSKHADLFVNVDKLGSFSPDEMAKIHIRKEKEPFLNVTFQSGSVGTVWCTFTEKQIDLDYRSPKTYVLMEKYIKFLSAKGVKLFRLDAFGYITKEKGSSCFYVEPKIYEYLDWFKNTAAKYGAQILPEVHGHPSYQYALANRGAYSYGFALPPLLLYSILDCNSKYLKNWLRTCPHNQVTVLDTHDGICIPDVEDLLPNEQIDAMVANVSERSGDPIFRRSAANVHSVGAIYQLTCTFYDALKRNDDAYIIARAIQFFTPGIPQVYYVGLFAGENNLELAEETGSVRAINRHYFSLEEADKLMKKKIVKRLVKIMRFRNTYPAFNGEFHLHYSNDSSLIVSWKKGSAIAKLTVDFNFNKGTISYYDKVAKKIKKFVV